MKKGRVKEKVSIFFYLFWALAATFQPIFCVLTPIILFGILLDVLPVVVTCRFVVVKTIFLLFTS